MRIIFCDDDPEIPQKLQKYLTEFFHSNNLKQPQYQSFSSGDELLADTLPVDVAFLDVEMPGLSGIHVGAKLKERSPYVKIFIVTSYPDYLDEAMKFHVFRYLTKPVDKKRLFRNMKDALYQRSVETRKIHIETKDGVMVKYADEIVCIESSGHKTLVHTVDGTFESVKSLDYWKNELSFGCFYQTYRSFLVNMKYVVSFSESTVELEKPDGTIFQAYMARRSYRPFKEAHLLYVESMK